MIGLGLKGLGLGASSGGIVLVDGDPMTATVREDGWTIEVKWKGFVDGGTAAPDPDGTPKLILSVTDTGYNTSRALTTRTRTIVGTVQLRQPYPDQTLPVDTEDASGASRVFALSEPIYASTAVGGNFAAGLYVDNGTGGSSASSNARLFSVTNSSAIAYEAPVANWACSGYLRGGTDGFAFEVYADHAFGFEGSPVAAVGVRVEDSASNVAWGYATALEASAQVSGTDPVPLVYKVTVDTTGLTDGAGTAHLVVYPWLASEAWDSATDGLTWPTPQVASMPVLIDRAGDYTEVYAAVDTVSGNDGTGVVSATKTTAEATPFLTVAGARAALKTHNNGRGHNDHAGAYILLKEDIAGFGESLAVNWTPGLTWGGFDIWTTATAKTIGITEAVSLTNRRIATLMEFRNLFIRSTGSNTFVLNGVSDGAVSGLPQVYARRVNCKISATTAAQTSPTFYLTGMVDDIGCEHVNASAYEFRATATNREHYRLALGTTYVSTATSTVTAAIWTAIGCEFRGVSFTDSALSVNNQDIDGQIVANCKVLTQRATSFFCRRTTVRGCVIAQNVFEAINATSAPALSVSADGVVNPVANAIERHNTVVGWRFNWLYNDTGSTAIPKTGVSQYSLYQQFNIKRDTFAPENAARTGNWKTSHGVGCFGRHAITPAADSATTGSPTGWLGEYFGQRGTVNVAITFTDDRSYTGTGAGGGDYLPTGTVTTLLNKVAAGRSVYPVDIRNTARKTDGTGSCGAYEVA